MSVPEDRHSQVYVAVRIQIGWLNVRNAIDVIEQSFAHIGAFFVQKQLYCTDQFVRGKNISKNADYDVVIAVLIYVGNRRVRGSVAFAEL